MYWVILEAICTFCIIFISIIKCSDGKRGEERRNAGAPPASEGQKSAKIEPEERKPQKSTTNSKPTPGRAASQVAAQSSAAPQGAAPQGAAPQGAGPKSNIVSKSNMPDDGYEACPDLNSKQLAKIAAET